MLQLPSRSTHAETSYAIIENYAVLCSGINKPVAVRDWLNKTQPKEDYILVIDSDTIMREPFVMTDLDLRPGISSSAPLPTEKSTTSAGLER